MAFKIGYWTEVSGKIVGVSQKHINTEKIETYPMAMTRMNPLANQRAELHM